MTPALRAEGLSKRFRSTVALEGFTLEVAAGEILALLGPSGCGKTTFLRVVAGFERPDRGSVELGGRLVSGGEVMMPPERRGVGFVFQDFALFPHMDVGANVGFGVRDRRTRAARVAETLALVGLADVARRSPHELSGGQQQRVALARALAPAPTVVLLDEPFSNLDAELRARVRTEVRAILRAAGQTAVFVTHDQQEAFDIADRVAVMRAGRVEQVGRAEEIYHTPGTRFVADFVGRADFLPVDVRDGSVHTELGSFPLGDARAEPGVAEIMLRPEDVELSADDGGDAEVIDRRFHGPLTISVVRLRSGRVLTSAHSSQEAFAIGERVRARFRPDHLVLFRGDRRLTWVRAQPRTGTDLRPR